MGKKTVEIDKQLLESVINKLEESATYANRTELYAATASVLHTEYSYKLFSPAWVYLRVKALDIKLKTPEGRKGVPNGEALKKWREEGKTKPQRKVDDSTPLIKYFTKEEKGKYLALAKSVKKGSLKAAVKLKCIECSNFQKDEIKNCQVFTCPLWPVRPYKTKLLKIEEKKDENCF